MKSKVWSIAAIFGTCLITACGGGQYSTSMDNNSTYTNEGEYSGDSISTSDDIYTAEGENAPAEEASAEETAVHKNQKLIKEVNMTIETQEYDKLLKNIEDKVKNLGGYIESLYTSNDNYNSEAINDIRNGEITARIPSAKLDSFVTSVAENSNVISRQESVRDVTLQYVDLKSHKKALETEQERLMALLEKADTLEAIVTLESRLTEVRYQIESMESQLRTFDNQIDYSTVYLTITEVKRITPVEVRTQSDWEKIKVGFSENLYRVINGVKNFGIQLIIALPLLVVTAIIVLLFVIVIRILIKINDRRNREKLEKLMNRTNTVIREPKTSVEIKSNEEEEQQK